MNINELIVAMDSLQWDIETFKKQEKESLKEFIDSMFEKMVKYGGIGLS